ncbi:conserved exported protein of unknown function [Rhodovastum atsumiense]|nr:DUF2066 domain-containing protein [Rhodovastum atsumiense]CAH2601748.1 conserved exported protein of unknown function [Rhodovastum atsumiense]
MKGRFLLAALLLAAPAARADDLFEGHAIVSGTGPASRAEALPRALREVMVKVSGEPALAEDSRLEGIDAAALVEDDVFLDRLTDMPHHDEQGTRDRPWDYIAHFDPAGIRAALDRLGVPAWTALRPRLLARISVRDQDGGTYPLSNDADDGERQRQALLAAARRYGLRVALPPRATPDAAFPGTVPLTGHLTWSEAELGWVGEWHLDWQGRAHDWRITGVSFDAAFRDALAGALAVLAGRR